jgi:hypothetical protein
MYHFSRCIYRELSRDILPDRPDHTGPGNHARVLRSCEAAVERLATDPHYFARPTKTLFNDIRIFFPMTAQCRVYKVVDHYLALAKASFEQVPVAGRLECRATTRRGTPCRRAPLTADGYCPSHQHLAETEHVALAA